MRERTKEIEYEDKAAARTFGHLLRQHRQRAQISQTELAKRIKKNQSYIAMLELGRRGPPNGQVVAQLVRIFRLHQDPLQLETFWLASRGVLDELGPYLVPLSPLEVGVEVRDYRMIWIVGHKPLECEAGGENPVYKRVLENINTGKTKYVYWIPKRSIDIFDMLRTSLERDSREIQGQLAPCVSEYLQCIIAPEILCAHQFAIYDPLDSDKRTGRIGIQGRDGTVGHVIPMSEICTDRLFGVLRPIYNTLIQEKEFSLDEKGRFTKHYP